MKKSLRIVSGVVAGMISVALLATSASAAPSDDADYLGQLQEIAGQPVTYQPDPSSPVKSPTIQAKALDPYVCNLYPSAVHLRKSGNYNTAGAKPYTNCTAGTPTSISQTSTLYIVEWAGLVYKPMQTKTSSNTGQKKLEQQNVAWTCTNKNNSVFQQKTNGVSVQAGKSYYATVQTVKASWGCGY